MRGVIPGRCEASNPESRDSPMRNCASGSGPSDHPGMTMHGSSLRFSQRRRVTGGFMQTELNKLVAALREFYAHENYLFEHDLGERTLTHRLAVHMEKQFPGW